MLSRLKQWLAPEQASEDVSGLLQRAAALLMLEIAQADDSVDVAERESIADSLQQTFQLTLAQCDELLAAAERESRELISLQGFTRFLVDELDEQQRYQVLVQLWRVAYADGRIDHYEEHMLRRIADLLYIPHRGFIQAKLQARPQSLA